MIQHLLHYVPSNLSNYYEPFLGGGALFFAICSRRDNLHAYLSDLNSELINAYKIIKERPDELIETLFRFQNEYYDSEDKSRYYYDKRDWRPSRPVDSAGRFLFLNKTCYNGLYRVNSRGDFNVPYGRYKHPKIIDEENIRAVSDALRDTNASLLVQDYRKAVAECGRNDFVYFDPPYQPRSKTSSFTDYTPNGFSGKDHTELAQEVQLLVERECTVLLSNSETAFTSRLYRQFEISKVTVNRPINSVGSGRRGYRELIVFDGPETTESLSEIIREK